MTPIFDEKEHNEELSVEEFKVNLIKKFGLEKIKQLSELDIVQLKFREDMRIINNKKNLLKKELSLLEDKKEKIFNDFAKKQKKLFIEKHKIKLNTEFSFIYKDGSKSREHLLVDIDNFNMPVCKIKNTNGKWGKKLIQLGAFDWEKMTPIWDIKL